MPTAVQIRSYRPDDLSQAKALEARVQPYCPEDQLEVEAMYERAGRAEEIGYRWMPERSSGPDPESVEYAADTYLAFWVAVLPVNAGADQVVGMVGVERADPRSDMPSGMPLAQEWRRRNDIAELRFLRVAEEQWEQGIGTQLSQTAIAWCRDYGFRALILNTPSLQKPALDLYRELDFKEVGRSFKGKSELVWLELVL